MDRAARWDGLLPYWIDVDNPGPVDDATVDAEGPARLAEIVAHARSAREAAGLAWQGYDVVHEGRSHGSDPTTPADPKVWARAGATWWMEGAWDLERTDEGRAELQRRVQAGPPG